MHSLLRRQIRRYLGHLEEMPPEWAAFLAAVDDAYQHADDDRRLLERSLELSSSELLDRHAAIRAGEEKLRTVIANAPLALFAVDADGVVTFTDGKALTA